MSYKQVLFASTAREKVLRGVTALSDAVGVTLGPRSKRVLIERKWGAPLICDDGVTIAKEFELKDPSAIQLKRGLERGLAVAINSGLDDGVVVDRMTRSSDCVGLNAASLEYVDLFEAGIVDPTKVVRTALENAVSVSSLLLLTEATMTEVPDAPKPTPGGPESAYGGQEL